MSTEPMTFHNHRPPRIIAPGGPVSRAVAVMAAADPDLARIRALRRAISARIQADIELLDALAGDPDFEPSLGSPEPFYGRTQLAWALGGTDDCENAECVDCDGEAVSYLPPVGAA